MNYMSAVQYVDSRSVEKNADKLGIPNTKRQRAICRQKKLGKKFSGTILFPKPYLVPNLLV